MLSAGDLDGDTYMVVWDEDLVKSFGQNHAPSAPEAVKKGVKSKEMIKSESDQPPDPNDAAIKAICDYFKKD